ncbi:hypothetical protein LTS18_005047, partial [Coniosporium uncinatum]
MKAFTHFSTSQQSQEYNNSLHVAWPSPPRPAAPETSFVETSSVRSSDVSSTTSDSKSTTAGAETPSRKLNKEATKRSSLKPQTPEKAHQAPIHNAVRTAFQKPDGPWIKEQAESFDLEPDYQRQSFQSLVHVQSRQPPHAQALQQYHQYAEPKSTYTEMLSQGLGKLLGFTATTFDGNVYAAGLGEPESPFSASKRQNIPVQTGASHGHIYANTDSRVAEYHSPTTTRISVDDISGNC